MFSVGFRASGGFEFGVSVQGSSMALPGVSAPDSTPCPKSPKDLIMGLGFRV